MTNALFDAHDVDHRPDPAERRAVRRLVLAGVLKGYRNGHGWSVNDASSRASIAPMTWRRLEEGLDVRRRSLTAVDSLLGVPFGAVTRALDDDLVMVDLAMAHGGFVVDAAQASTPAELVDVLAERSRSGTTSPAPRAPRAESTGASPYPNALLDTSLQQYVMAAGPVPAISDLTRAAQLVDQITRRSMTPALENAVAAILAAMPDLITPNIHDATAAVDALAASSNSTLNAAAAEIAHHATSAAMAAVQEKAAQHERSRAAFDEGAEQ